MPITSNQISQELLSALGLPKHVTAFSLHVRAGDIVTVDCEYYPDDLASLEKALAQYTLEQRPDAAAFKFHPEDSIEFQSARAKVIGFDAWMRARIDAAHADYMAGHAAGGIAYN